MSIEESTSTPAEAEQTTSGIRVRALEQGDFFAWYELFAGYADFYNTTLSDERAMRAWAWLHGDASAVRGLVAVDGDDTVVGIAHIQEFERLLENDRGLYLEDLFVHPDHREKGVATALLEHLKQEAHDRGFSLIRWVTAEDNETARKFYDGIAQKTDWVTYDLKLG